MTLTIDIGVLGVLGVTTLMIDNACRIESDELSGAVYSERCVKFLIITLRAKLSGAVYCYRSCLCVCNGRAGRRCLFVGLLPR